ncbi:sialate O-acetylesterase [Tichowtungia aerotolerans]|uniref:Sialate O-acetylesterase domain-containing protein n=1 Tax=Tichowtungia aerotolerans TaxID=2697043 RepID=A0A6P1MBM5_9BACT|nr:sialate O-acetylesterase [Tichowtungia aerotolerans]QHI69944.1 hypothetical protein GT409_10935 [Tichowtungia aerotolerans]
MISLLVLALAGMSGAELSFAPVFNEGAVLQCDMPVNVWGTADPGATVTVSFAGQTQSAVADSSRHWNIVLGPMSASSEPRKLAVVSSIDDQKSSIDNVVVGEVWLATGQSNMVMPLRNSTGGDERLKMTIPEIRFMKVPQQTGIPPKPMNAEQLAWDTFRPGPNGKVAAVAFFFAEYLQKNIGGTVGILQCSYGGTPCQAWTPLWALDEKPELKYYADIFRKGCESGKSTDESQAEIRNCYAQNQKWNEWHKNQQGPRPEPPHRPSADNLCFQQAPVVLYENMTKAIIPYTARGVIWYQGEGNAGNPEEYKVLFPTMIEAWRSAWNRPDLPFYFVQLAACDHPVCDWPGLRAAQTFTRDTVSNTGMALAIDKGEEKDIHPRAKQPVGERLARLALANVYGQDVVSRGPAVQTVEKNGTNVQVVFQYSEKGLQTSDGQSDVPGFEVAGADGDYQPATARIVSKDTVELGCAGAGEQESVRYAWHNWIEPPVTLQNSAGLPAEPFSAKLD